MCLMMSWKSALSFFRMRSEILRHSWWLASSSSRLRKRIDYYIRPYNNDYLYAKYMTFGDPRRRDEDEASHHEWRKISDLILKKDKALFHDIIKHMRDSPGPND